MGAVEGDAHQRLHTRGVVLSGRLVLGG